MASTAMAADHRTARSTGSPGPTVAAMKVGILTGGGDCPGLNAVIRAVVRKGEQVHGDTVVGFLDGWRGVIEGSTTPLDVERMRVTLPRGGTVLGTSRTNPYKVEGGAERCRATLEQLGIEALVAIGGPGPRAGGHHLHPDGGLRRRGSHPLRNKPAPTMERVW